MANAKAKEFFETMNMFRYLMLKTKQKNGIHQSEIMMLHAIACSVEANKSENKEGVKVTTLSEYLNITKSATSKMLSNMEEKNYIVRKMDKKDRRVVYVEITQEGKEHLEKKQEDMMKFMDHMVEEVGEKDMDELIRISKKMFAIITKEYATKKD